jgi:hypothetical protein
VVLIHGQEFTHLRRSLQSSRCEEVRFARDSPLEGDGFELPVPRHSKLCDPDRGMRPRKSVRTLGPWWKRTGGLPLDLGALGCLALDIFSSRSLYPPPSQF